MRFGSLFSGIEAASVAWSPLGWRCAWTAEVDPFCRAVLEHHYPGVPNLGDVTAPDFCARARDHGPVDLIAGGSPCQSFSVAGKRLGLDDPRGNLALHFFRVVHELRPRWFLFENVPGLLSINRGRDFGALLWIVAQLGYGWAYRVLDAQFFGVPQRRRRVFIVGHLGDWRPATAVLFEPQSLRRHLAPGREAWPGVAHALGAGAAGGQPRFDPSVDTLAVVGPLQSGGTPQGHGTAGVNDQVVMQGHVLPLAFQDRFRGDDGRGHDRPPPVTHGLVGALDTVKPWNIAQGGMLVRRLTPRECERLQGFPDDYTLIPNYRRGLRASEVLELAAYLGLPLAEARALGATPDGPRYKALGNSWAIPPARWIGTRIEALESARREARKAA